MRGILAGRISMTCGSGSGMRSRSKRILICGLGLAVWALGGSFHVLGDDPGSWPVVLSSIGLMDGGDRVVVAPAGSVAPVEEWMARVEWGTILVLEGEWPAFGFRA